METLKAKKPLSLLLAIIMLFTMIPTAIFSSAAENPLPVMKAYTSVTGDYHDYKTKVVTVTFLDEINTEGSFKSWDVSAAGDGSVMAWMNINESETAAAGQDRYDVYIGGKGGVSANPNSSNLFYGFSVLKTVNGFENLHTENVTNLSYFFEACVSLETVDLSSFDTSNVTNFFYLFYDCKSLISVNLNGWDTSSATNMGYMFNNCCALTVLDISSFNTNKVTNMFKMFYLCSSLKTLYTGDDWSVEQVTNSDQMFNCCYVIEGKKSYSEVPAPYDKKYATTDYFLTYKAPEEAVEYTVTYEFTGDIPEGVTVPVEFSYNEGSKVNVEPIPSAEGYIFSGWSTDDAAVTDNSFTINNNVHFVGSWSKLYTVTYKYAEGYELPENAPALPETLSYKAGTGVDVNDKAFVNGYVFEGWTTDDADVTADGKFEMPEKDVVLYGYFRKPVSHVEINNKIDGEIILNKDETTVIQVTVKPEDATIKEVIYDSGNDEIVIVDKDGNVTAVGEGTTTITVSSKSDPDIKDTVTVTVKIPVTDVTVDKNDITLNKGDKDKITAEVNPEATNKELTYESSDETVVKVDENGNIEAVGEGEAVITVTSKDDPTKKETVTVTVKVPVTELTVEKNEYTLNVDDIDKINASVNEDATNKELIYESDDSGVVKVDSDGYIVAVGEGEAIITITSKDDPTKKETVKVTVKIPVEDVKADKEDITLNKGDKDKITVTVTPDDATDKNVTYESSDETVVKVDENGNIEAVGEGEATITITSKDDPTKKETVKVKVEKPAEPEIPTEPEKVPVDKVTVEKSDFILEKGETDKIAATVTPDNATEKGVTYKSADESIVKVDENGNITAVGEGKTYITVISKDDPTKAATVFVTVKPVRVPVEELITDREEITLDRGQTDKITVTVTPDGATEKGLTYESSDEKVVKVDKNGKITAVGEGEATVTVTSKDDPSKKITVKITVEKPEYTITVPELVTIFQGEKKPLGVVITPDDGTIVPIYKSSDESIVKIDAKGNITGVGVGAAVITADFGGGDIRLIPVTVLTVPVKHHVCFGKTDGIGWYEVSVNGGDFFPQGPNSTLEVENGSVLVVRVQDMWIDDEFDFYVNGKKVPLDPANTITVVVDGYMLIGALSMDVPVPDAEESVSLLQKLLNAIRDFFAMIKSWFTKK